jgi:hypothetical protein
VYTANLALRGLSFLAFRSWIAPACIAKGFYMYGASGFVAKFRLMPVIVQIGVCFNILFFGFLNTNWSYMVVIRFIKHARGEKRKPKKTA